MKYCSKCGADLGVGSAGFCPGCGAPVEADTGSTEVQPAAGRESMRQATSGSSQGAKSASKSGVARWLLWSAFGLLCVAVIGLAVALVFLTGDSDDREASGDPAIWWEDALDYEGDTVTVIGPAVEVEEDSEGDYQLCLGSEEDGFVCVVPRGSVDEFGGSDDLEDLTDNMLAVNGEVDIDPASELPTIECTEASQIIVLGPVDRRSARSEEDETTTTVEEVEGTTAGPTIPVTIATTPRVRAIDWRDAGDYEGQVVTITGQVAAADDLFEQKGIARYMVRLGGDVVDDHFNIAFALNLDGSWPAYLAGYESLIGGLEGETIEVTGLVTLNSFESCYQIMMNDADYDVLPDDAVTAGFEMVVK